MTWRDDEIGGRVAPLLQPGMSVLDLGSGTGKLSGWLAREVGIRPTLADVTEFDNRISGFPYLRMADPLRVPAQDASFDAVMMLFVLHHIERWEDQETLLKEAARVARHRIVLIEDTPTTRIDRAWNVAWDWLLNRRHGIPTPFTFRSADGWRKVFAELGLEETHSETYRGRWPTLLTYHHTVFALTPGRGTLSS